jgi:hypothetical protein
MSVYRELVNDELARLADARVVDANTEIVEDWIVEQLYAQIPDDIRALFLGARLYLAGDGSVYNVRFSPATVSA